MSATASLESASQPKLKLSGRLLMGCGILLYALFVSGANACLYEHGQLPFKPRDFTLGMSALCLLLALFQRLSFSPLAVYCLVLPTLRVIDSTLLVRFTTEMGGGQSGLVATLIAVLMVSLVSLVLLATPIGMLTLRRAAMAVVIILCGSILYEAMGFAKYTAIPGRAAGFLTQPNESIICVCLVLGIVLTLCEHFWINAAMIAISAMGVGLTLSRSGMVVFALMVVTFIALNLRQHFSKILVLIALSIPATLLGVTYLMNSASSRNFGTDTNAKARIEAIFGGSVDKMESAERMKDLTDGWEAVTKSPMVGYGTGCSTSKWQPHNGWVGVWLELGLGGVLLLASMLVALSVACARARGRGIYCLIPLWLFTVFSQNLLENTAYLSCAAVLAFWVTQSRFRLALQRPAAH